MKWMKKSPRFRTKICGSNKVLFHVQIEPTILITVKIDEVIAQFTTSPIQYVLRWYDRIVQVYTVTIQVILLYITKIFLGLIYPRLDTRSLSIIIFHGLIANKLSLKN